MSVLQKGIVTVVAVTMLASALIVFTGKSATADVNNISKVTEPQKKPITDQLGSRASISVSGTLTKGILVEKSQNNMPSQKNKLLLSKASTAPPPIGPFQVAQPMAYKSSKMLNSDAPKINDVAVPPTIPMKQKISSGIRIPSQNRKSPTAPTIKIMNQQIPQPPKHIVGSQHQPEQHSMKMNAPVNTLVKPQAPVQQVPDVFVAPQMQRYMYVPVPVPMNQQLPQVPVTGIYKVLPDTPANRVEHKDLSTLNKK